MAFAWRLADPIFAGDLEGNGNRMTGARWNSAGRGVLYCSENLSLCVLETLVHLNPEARAVLPPRVALRVSYPDDAKAEIVQALGPPPFFLVSYSDGATPYVVTENTNPDWARRRIGDHWLAKGQFLILSAPSVIVPQERNVMFNPAHAAMADVRVVETFPFIYDTRLFRA
jgi:RES domain-containing protein